MFVCCECCVLWDRGLCEELVTLAEESYVLWCVFVCDLETSWVKRPWPTRGPLRQQQTNKLPCVQLPTKSWTSSHYEVRNHCFSNFTRPRQTFPRNIYIISDQNTRHFAERWLLEELGGVESLRSSIKTRRSHFSGGGELFLFPGGSLVKPATCNCFKSIFRYVRSDPIYLLLTFI